LLGNNLVNNLSLQRITTIGNALLNSGEINKLHQQYGLCFPLGLCIAEVKEANSEPRSRFVESVSCVEAGLNTSTVALRVVGGNEKGSLESETVKYVRESHGTRTRD
jgi:hypothetical protein